MNSYSPFVKVWNEHASYLISAVINDKENKKEVKDARYKAKMVSLEPNVIIILKNFRQ